MESPSCTTRVAEAQQSHSSVNNDTAAPPRQTEPLIASNADALYLRLGFKSGHADVRYGTVPTFDAVQLPSTQKCFDSLDNATAVR